MKPWVLPICFAAGALLSRAALALAAPHFPVDVAQPLPVATNWGVYGVAAWLAVALTIAGAMFVYVRLIADPPVLRVTLAITTATMIVSSLWLPLLSSDVYAYAAYGEMARLHLDPYVHHNAFRDTILAAARWQWSGTFPVCVYGEAFVAVARALVTMLNGLGTLVVLNAFRVLSAASLLACAAAAYVAAATPSTGRRAAAFIATNPVAIYTTAVGGHNDALTIACILAGFALLRRAPFFGGLMVAAAAAIKAPALAAAAALAVSARSFSIALGTLAGTGLAVLASLGLIEAVRSSVAPHGVYQPYASVQALSPFIAIALACALLLRLQTLASTPDRWALVALCAWLAIPNPYSWYALWPIAIAAFARDGRIVAAALTISCASVLRYLPDAAGAPAPAVAFILGLGALVAYLPLVKPGPARAIITSP